MCLHHQPEPTKETELRISTLTQPLLAMAGVSKTSSKFFRIRNGSHPALEAAHRRNKPCQQTCSKNFLLSRTLIMMMIATVIVSMALPITSVHHRLTSARASSRPQVRVTACPLPRAGHSPHTQTLSRPVLTPKSHRRATSRQHRTIHEALAQRQAETRISIRWSTAGSCRPDKILYEDLRARRFKSGRYREAVHWAVRRDRQYSARRTPSSPPRPSRRRPPRRQRPRRQLRQTRTSQLPRPITRRV